MSERAETSIYELLLSLWRREREEEKLAKLPEDLGRKIREYVGSVKHYLKVSDKQTLSAELRESEMGAVARLLNDLFDLRLRKILRAIFKGERPENLLSFESRIFVEVSGLIREYREEVRRLMTAVAYNDWKPIESTYKPVYFLKEVPKMTGSDLKSYGPFKPGDIAVLPSEDARELEMRNVLRILRILEPGSR